MAISFAPATERQVSYLASLLADRACTTDFRATAEARMSGGTLDKATASKMIDTLMATPRVARGGVAAATPLTVGMYRKDGVIYRVQRSRESGGMYAKRLDLLATGAEFVYAAGAIRTLTLADSMTREEAQAWGVETGICCVCSADLTDPVSVARGIGPVCARRF